MGFLREAALLAAQEPTHLLRRMFEDKTGLLIQQFIDISFTVAAELLQGSRVIRLEWFEVFRKAYSAAVVDRYLSTVARTFAELRAFCRALPDAQEKVASEYFEFTALGRYPFLRDGDRLYCWHPAVFFRGMEVFVNSVLSESQGAFIEPFSKLFERHVVNEAQSTGTTFFGEDQLREWLPDGAQVPDGLLAYGSCNVIIESKAGLFDESVMTVGHSTMFAHKTKALVTAAKQGWSASESIRKEGKAPTIVAEAPIDYLLIVTNKELSAGRGTTLDAMYPVGKLSPPSEDAARTLPLAHIYVLWIEDFERLVAAVREKEIDLPAFLQDCVARDADPRTMVFYLHQHLDRLEVAHRTSALVHDAEYAAAQRLEGILPK